ncbi:MAG TPA: hypothetical protein VIU93_01295 [Gallionellaceae bacterium]
MNQVDVRLTGRGGELGFADLFGRRKQPELCLGKQCTHKSAELEVGKNAEGDVRDLAQIS